MVAALCMAHPSSYLIPIMDTGRWAGELQCAIPSVGWRNQKPIVMTTLQKKEKSLASRLLDDDLFSFPESFLGTGRTWFPEHLFKGTAELPAVNIKDNGGAFVVEVAAPGYRKEDLKVNVKDGVLTISSEKRKEEEKKDEGYTRKEFSYTSFSRSFHLPNNVDEKAIEAAFADGILKITVRKTEKAPESVGQSIVIR
jgi:HSP20 family protein